MEIGKCGLLFFGKILRVSQVISLLDQNLNAYTKLIMLCMTTNIYKHGDA